MAGRMKKASKLKESLIDDELVRELEKEEKELEALPEPEKALERWFIRRKPPGKDEITYAFFPKPMSLALSLLRTFRDPFSSLFWAIAHEDPLAFLTDTGMFHGEYKLIGELARLGDPEATKGLLVTDDPVSMALRELDPRSGRLPHIAYPLKFVTGALNLRDFMTKNMAYSDAGHEVFLTMGSPGAFAHELGHSADFARSKYPLLYSFIVGQPFIILYREIRAWNRGSHIVINGAVRAFPKLDPAKQKMLIRYLVRIYKMMDKIKIPALLSYGIGSIVPLIPESMRPIILPILGLAQVAGVLPIKLVRAVYRWITRYSGKEDLKRKLLVHAKINRIDPATTKQMLQMVDELYDKTSARFIPFRGAAKLALILSRFSAKPEEIVAKAA